VRPDNRSATTTTGPSFVRPVTSSRARKLALSSGKNAPAQPEHETPEQQADESSLLPSGRPLPAGKELLLECVTHELGKPRANLWLWFRDGQTIGGAQEDPDGPLQRAGGEPAPLLRDNPISDRLRQDLSQPPPAGPAVRLLAMGRYLFIPAVQLAHKGNYSCVAVNRLGAGPNPADQSPGQSAPAPAGRDSYQLRVALAPSFVQPLAAKTHWQEGQSAASTKQLELVCHVQCEPICQLEWLHNNELLDIKSADGGRLPLDNNYVSYHVRHTIMDENAAANMFRSVESRLVLSFNEGLESSTKQSRADSDNNNIFDGAHKKPDRRPLIDRDRLLARRHFLNNSNFTCQSGPNAMGPPVRSTTRLVVQCK
jgi:hypothetical protein